MKVVSLLIPVNRIAIPRLEGEEFADLIANELMGEGNAGVESAHGSNLNMNFREGPSFPGERQERIAEMVATRGKVRIGQLTELFGVSEPTVRKDLTLMEQRGLLKRTHGGAVSIRPPVEQAMASRLAENANAKRLIGKACVELLSPGEAVFLDSGTTVQQIADALAGSGLRLTVLTDSPSIAEMVADMPGVSHLPIGGQLRRISGCLTGPLTTENLKQFTISTAFIGASGLFGDGGFRLGPV